MRTEHYLFHVLGVTSKSRMKFVDSKEISLKGWILQLSWVPMFIEFMIPAGAI